MNKMNETSQKPHSECFNFVEHPHWRQKHPLGPITWDGWCSICGFKLENRSWGSNYSIEGNGRRLAHVKAKLHYNGESFLSERRMIVCSECCPQILRGGDE